MELDKLDREIVRKLQLDGRMPFVQLAKELGVTEGTIRRKVGRLVQDGLIRFVAVADPFAMGFDTPAIISIKAETSRVMEVAEELGKLPGVRFVALATGSFDIIVEGYWASNRHLSTFLTTELSKVKGILEYSTSLVLKIVKQSYDWGDPSDTDTAINPSA